MIHMASISLCHICNVPMLIPVSGNFTILDHYTFKWPDSRMALALGLGEYVPGHIEAELADQGILGSLFNHADPPNVSYTLDTKTESIRYTTVRDIDIDEELCIYYGHSLWFSLASDSSTQIDNTQEVDDGWGGLAAVEDLNNDLKISNPYEDGDQNEIIPEEDLPFTRLKQAPEEEDAGSIRTSTYFWIQFPYKAYLQVIISGRLDRRCSRASTHHNTFKVSSSMGNQPEKTYLISHSRDGSSKRDWTVPNWDISNASERKGPQPVSY